jgi:hypothetical protein
VTQLCGYEGSSQHAYRTPILAASKLPYAYMFGSIHSGHFDGLRHFEWFAHIYT